MPISRGSLRACSSQYDIRSADALETFILSMEASNLSCCTVLLAWAMLLVLAVLLDIFDDSSFLKSARFCVGQCLQVLNGGVNQKSQLQIEKMLTPMSFPYELSAVAVAAAAAAAAAAAPAAILGSLCGGGRRSRSRLPDPPSLGFPFLTYAFGFSSLAFPPVRLPAGRLLTSGRVTVWTQRSRGARLPPSLPTCLHSALSASHGE